MCGFLGPDFSTPLSLVYFIFSYTTESLHLLITNIKG